ncbi:MAG: hypothetical protein ACM31D_04715 [Bacteroidota bacterium]
MATRGELNRSVEGARQALQNGLDHTARLYARQAAEMELQLSAAEGRDFINPFGTNETALHGAVVIYLASARTKPFPATKVAIVSNPGTDVLRWSPRVGTTHAARCVRED